MLCIDLYLFVYKCKSLLVFDWKIKKIILSSYLFIWIIIIHPPHGAKWRGSRACVICSPRWVQTSLSRSYMTWSQKKWSEGVEARWVGVLVSLQMRFIFIPLPCPTVNSLNMREVKTGGPRLHDLMWSLWSDLTLSVLLDQRTASVAKTISVVFVYSTIIIKSIKLLLQTELNKDSPVSCQCYWTLQYCALIVESCGDWSDIKVPFD